MSVSQWVYDVMSLIGFIAGIGFTFGIGYGFWKLIFGEW